MLRRTASISTLSVLCLLMTLVGAGVSTARQFDWSSATDMTVGTTAENDTEDTKGPSQKKDGKGFVSALTAPFRAIGRLFDGGKKKDQQPKRVGDKTAKFESTPVMRVSNNSSPVPTGIPKAEWDPFQVHLSKGREMLSAGDANGAIAELTLATSINSKSGEAFKLLGIAYENRLLHDRALKAFEAAVKVDGNNPDHLNNYGFLLYKTGDYEHATKYLKRASKLAPKSARIWNNLAVVQCQRGKFNDAYESFVNAVGEFGGHVNIAIQLQRLGYPKEAIKHLELAHQMQPTSSDVLTRLVALYDITGRTNEAEAARKSLSGLKTFADAKP